MKLRLCKKCYAAIMDAPNLLTVVRAMCETGQYVCPFSKPECGRHVDAQGKVLANVPLKTWQSA